MQNNYLTTVAAAVCLMTAVVGAAGSVEAVVAQTGPVRSAVSASSTLLDNRDVYRYSADKAFDGDPTTAWVEGAYGDGIGERLRVHFAEPVTIDRIRIMPGLYTEQWYGANNRVRQLRLRTPGLSQNDRELEFPDGMLPREISFEPITVGLTGLGHLDLEIVSTYAGTRWQDTAIAEIEFYHGDERIELRPPLSVWPAFFTIGAARASTLFLLVGHSTRRTGVSSLDTYHELVVIDVSEPRRPSLLSTLTLSKDVWVEEDGVTRTDPQWILGMSAPAGSPYVFATTRSDLHVIDVSQLTAPRAVAMLPVRNEPTSLVATRDHAYIAGTSRGSSDGRVGDTTGISVVDVSVGDGPIGQQFIVLEDGDWRLAVDDVAQRLIAHNRGVGEGVSRRRADRWLRLFDIQPDGSLQEISVQTTDWSPSAVVCCAMLAHDSVLVWGEGEEVQVGFLTFTSVFRLKPDHSLEHVPLLRRDYGAGTEAYDYPLALVGDRLMTRRWIFDVRDDEGVSFDLRETLLVSTSVFGSTPSAAELLLPQALAEAMSYAPSATLDALGSHLYVPYHPRGSVKQVFVIGIDDIGTLRLLFP